MNHCKRCGNELTGNFCSNCGHPAQLKRIDGRYIKHEIEHVLHFEKGIFYTIKVLFIRPGQNIKEFIAEDRNRLVKPIIFIIITSLIYSLINNFFHWEDNYLSFEGAEASSVVVIFDWIQNHYGFANIIMSFFIALWIKLFFRKYAYNFFELLILLCFVMGIGMLILSVFGILEGITNAPFMQVAGLMCVIYVTWAIGQFFDGRKFSSYVKALISYILGMFTFMMLAIILGVLMDLGKVLCSQ